MGYIYEVRFVTKKGGEKSRAIQVNATNQKDAIEQAKQVWYADHSEHMFTISAKKLKFEVD